MTQNGLWVGAGALVAATLFMAGCSSEDAEDPATDAAGGQGTTGGTGGSEASGGNSGEPSTAGSTSVGPSVGGAAGTSGAGGSPGTAGSEPNGTGGSVGDNGIPAGYLGTPFSDTVYPGGAQLIPGRVQLEYYDVGGEGVTFHDDDGTNSGSGGLNPADGTYLNEFRINEPVDISYTKAGGVDDSPYNMVEPEMGQLYLGWTGVGEWVNLTVEIATAGTYSVQLMYTSNGPGAVSLALNNEVLEANLPLVDTNDPADATEWRQWHHWNKMELAQVSLPAGTHLLTVGIAANGNMNLDYLEFTLIE